MNELEELFGEFERETNVDLKNLSTMKVGGRGKIVLFPKTIAEVEKVQKICEQNAINLFVLGNGSNVLFSDEGFAGAIVKLTHFQKFQILQWPKKKCKKLAQKNIRFYQGLFCGKGRKVPREGCEVFHKKQKFLREKHEKKCKKFAKNAFLIEIGAGVNLFALNLKLKNLGASGLEFSYGIPATLGGFLRMNGGCFGHEICELVQSVQVAKNGGAVWLEKHELEFAYRDSNLKNCIILGAKLRFFAKKTEKIEKSMQKFLFRKRKTQPCNLPSLGSVFKKNGDRSPAKIIDQLGLKGFSVGGAQVSTIHAGFVVNTGFATSADVKNLIFFLSQKLSALGFKAETEIVFA